MNQDLIDALDIAAADAELFGQEVHSALNRAYWAAKKGDANALEDAILIAKREDAHFRGIMLNVKEALRGLMVPDSDRVSNSAVTEK